MPHFQPQAQQPPRSVPFRLPDRCQRLSLHAVALFGSSVENPIRRQPRYAEGVHEAQASPPDGDREQHRGLASGKRANIAPEMRLMTALDITLAYHERTKHRPFRFAPALGYMDWETQPDPFRRFEG